MSRSPAFVAAAVAVAGAVVLVVVVAARAPPPPMVHRRVTAGDGAAVRVARTRLGRILVDARGHTLYLFLEDRHGRSPCGAPCARVWPPVIVSGRLAWGRASSGGK